MLVSNIIESALSYEEKNAQPRGKRPFFSVPEMDPGKKKSFILGLLLGLTMLAIFVTANSFPKLSKEGLYRNIYNGLYSMDLIPKKERFTELYFENYNFLPTKASRGETIPFSFVIHNLESEDKEYTYVVYMVSGDGAKKIDIDKGKVSIKDTESRTIEESYIFGQERQKETIVVELEGKKQKIHFLINK